MLAAAKDNVFSDQPAVKICHITIFFLFWDITTEDRRYFQAIFKLLVLNGPFGL